ncbi:MAG: cyclic pyranopterin monophosphate synthase MoaC [Candidatus Brockarchaeota archaeon]|nr:cyclic pyranopterin monophosphate synthase MoaC [Candidatus Brockarchaeota archaeon]
MVDVSWKKPSPRRAVAKGWIRLRRETIEAIRTGRIAKGDVLTVARVSAILAVKKTPELIPGCHPIPITHVAVEFQMEEDKISTSCEVASESKTGVEMEALTGVAMALLTIWDMVKEVEKDENGQYPHTAIGSIIVEKKVKE